MNYLGATESGHDPLTDLARHLSAERVAVDWRKENVSRIEKALEVQDLAWVERAVGANIAGIEGGLTITHALEQHYRTREVEHDQ